MMASVDFDDELVRMFAEVGDEAADRGLLAEMEASLIEIAELTPKFHLRVRRVASKPVRNANRAFRRLIG